MQEKFNLPFKPYSINDLYYGNRKHGKKPAAREWSYKIFHHLKEEEFIQKFKKLREKFDAKKHYYEVNLKFFFPYEKLFTKVDGRLKTPDLSNIEKPLIDLLFLPEYFEKKTPFGAKNLNIDDRYIGKLTSEKLACPNDEQRIEIIIKIKDLDLIK